MKEAARLGFERAVVGGEEGVKIDGLGLKVTVVTTVAEGWEALS